jgi:hypothetical protein
VQKKNKKVEVDVEAVIIPKAQGFNLCYSINYQKHIPASFDEHSNKISQTLNHDIFYPESQRKK